MSVLGRAKDVPCVKVTDYLNAKIGHWFFTTSLLEAVTFLLPATNEKAQKAI